MINSLEDNIGENLNDLGYDDGFLTEDTEGIIHEGSN